MACRHKNIRTDRVRTLAACAPFMVSIAAIKTNIRTEQVD